jgi:hypothetical protein
MPAAAVATDGCDPIVASMGQGQALAWLGVEIDPGSNASLSGSVLRNERSILNLTRVWRPHDGGWPHPCRDQNSEEEGVER